jgi:hypothetical protein
VLFPLWVITNKAAVNIYVQIFGARYLFFWNQYSGIVFLDHKAHLDFSHSGRHTVYFVVDLF